MDTVYIETTIPSYLTAWPAVETFLADNGYHVPIVCTPEELMGDDSDVTSF